MDGNQLAVAANIGESLGLGVDLREILVPLHGIPRARILHLLHGLQDAGVDISSIGKSEELQNYFFTIVEHVAGEANRAKISRWKDSVIHLAMDFQAFPFKDNFIRTLEDLTEFDLTVLLMTYSMRFDRKRELQSKVQDYFEHCDVGRPITGQAIKRLASHALLDEQGSGFGLGGSGQFWYAQNELGETFINFISTEYRDAPDSSEFSQPQYAPD